MEEIRKKIPQGAVELSDDMLDLVAGGADLVDERKQSLLDMMDKADQYKAAQENTRSAGQDALQNAMKQGLINSQMGTTQIR